ncbi:hypothetical protein ACPCF3_13350 [Enterococcus mundtii]|uniref:hypothetical protein n=1 Tax=Enterococcus TaxID=1350 RepID=UPI000F7D037D|nr:MULTISPECIES: hypothetical protein [Enterococcus]AZP92152.1 hypothetical protein CYK55_03025 [Enterococcus mundtii]
MKKKSRYLLWTILLFFGMFHQSVPLFAAEGQAIESNKNVGFYGEIDYEGDPKPQPPSEEQAQPSDRDEYVQVNGQLPKLNQVIPSYGLLGLLILLWVIRTWLIRRDKRISRQVALSSECDTKNKSTGRTNK